MDGQIYVINTEKERQFERASGIAMSIAAALLLVLGVYCIASDSVVDLVGSATGAGYLGTALSTLLIGLLLVAHKKNVASVLLAIGVVGAVFRIIRDDFPLQYSIDGFYLLSDILTALSIICAVTMINPQKVPSKTWYVAGLFRVAAFVVGLIIDIVVFSGYQLPTEILAIMICEELFNIIMAVSFFLLGKKNTFGKLDKQPEIILTAVDEADDNNAPDDADCTHEVEQLDTDKAYTSNVSEVVSPVVPAAGLTPEPDESEDEVYASTLDQENTADVNMDHNELETRADVANVKPEEPFSNTPESII